LFGGAKPTKAPRGVGTELYRRLHAVNSRFVASLAVHCCGIKKNVIVASQLYDVGDKGYCGSPLLKEANHYTFRTIPQEHWSIGMSMARPS